MSAFGGEEDIANSGRAIYFIPKANLKLAALIHINVVFRLRLTQLLRDGRQIQHAAKVTCGERRAIPCYGQARRIRLQLGLQILFLLEQGDIAQRPRYGLDE